MLRLIKEKVIPLIFCFFVNSIAVNLALEIVIPFSLHQTLILFGEF